MKDQFDPRTKYRSLIFKKKLQQASGYKRSLNGKIPTNKWEIFLKYIGLENKKTVLFFILFLTLWVYAIYIPNFFYIKNIEIKGVNSTKAELIKNNIHNYLQIHSAWPQQNLVLLSKSKLKKYLLGDPEILEVNKIEKKFFNNLTITLLPREEKYLVDTGINKFTLSTDGKIISEIQGTSTPENLILLKISQNIKHEKSFEDFLTPILLKKIKEISDLLPQIAKINIIFFELDPIIKQDLVAQTQNGFKINIDSTSDFKKVFNNLSLLLSQIPSDKKSLISYIDMRIQDRGYVCFKNTECSKETFFQNSASSTLE